MCGTCGCSSAVASPGPTRLSLEQRVLERNDRLAAQTRRRLDADGVFAINLMSAPGAGKTTLLERTLADLRGELVMSVIEGDQATDHDAERIRSAGGRAVQINTGAGCHLDAAMVARAVEQLDPARGSVIVIENVGNLVCPALFDLGERARIVIVSVTDGDDKPLKYPHMFRASDVLVLNKVDLLPYVAFDPARCLAYAREVKPGIEWLELSATRGDGLDGWYAWLRRSALAGRPGIASLR